LTSEAIGEKSDAPPFDWLRTSVSNEADGRTGSTQAIARVAARAVSFWFTRFNIY
jgi:hypothetical protein